MNLTALTDLRLKAAGYHPKIMQAAMMLVGITEKHGPADNPVILAWAVELGVTTYRHDETPWCGLFAGVCVHRANYIPAKDPLWALNWAHWGEPAPTAMFGDVLVFHRPGGGHVGFYAAEDETHYWVLGGNQGDQVQFAPVLKALLTAARRPPYKAQPASVQRVKVVTISRSEVSLA